MLRDEGRRVTVEVKRPTVIKRDGLERPGDPVDVASAVHPDGLITATAEDNSVAWRRDRPGSRASVSLCLITYDRRVLAIGDHVVVTNWPIGSSKVFRGFVREPERMKRTQQIIVADHLDEAAKRGGQG